MVDVIIRVQPCFKPLRIPTSGGAVKKEEEEKAGDDIVEYRKCYESLSLSISM